MTGPSMLDQLAFCAWMVVIYALIAVPLYGACKFARRGT